MSSPPERTHSVEVAAGPMETVAVLADVAEAWGAMWEEDGVGGPGVPTGGSLAMPVLAGIRRGFARGRVDLHPEGAGSREARTRVVYAVEELHLHVHPPALVILLLSAMGGLLTVVWPFFPELLPVAPFGALLALGGWFLVVSRLQNSGPQELLELVAEEVEGEGEGGGGGAAGGGDAAAAEEPPKPIG